MDRWIALHEGATGPKLRLFSTLAECSEAEALGVLGYIWIWGVRDNVNSSGLMKNATLDHLRNIFSNAITKGLDPDKIVNALIQSGWIDELDGSLYIHDWPDHQKPWVQYKAKVEANTRRKRNQRLRQKQEEGDEAVPVYDDTKPDESPPLDPEEHPAENPPTEPPETPKPLQKTSGSSYTPAFEQFWMAYPRKDEKANAYKKYQARLKDGFSEAELLEAARAYAAQCNQQRTEKKYIKLGKTFLSESTPFTDYLRKDDGTSQCSSSGPPGDWKYDPGNMEGSL